MTNLLYHSLASISRLVRCFRWGAAGVRAALGLLLGLAALAAQAQRPQLELDLQPPASSLGDPTYVYIDAGATTGVDSNFDAVKIPNSNGLNLATLATDGQRLAINGLPFSAFIAPYTINLFVGVPQYGTYTLTVNQLVNFDFVDIYLTDALSPTRQLLAPGTAVTVSLTAANTNNTGATSTRFALVFEPNGNPLPLPVTLVAFSAERQGTAGWLRWATATEKNSAYFEPESSLDGTVFTALGRVAAAGNTTQAHSYQFLDDNLARYGAGQVYYRLRQVDADGTTTFSPVRQLAVPAGSFSAEAFPTTVLPGQALHLLLHTPTAGPAQLHVSDATGRPVVQRVLDLPGGASTLTLPEAGHWATGLYLLHLQQGSQRQATRVVVP